MKKCLFLLLALVLTLLLLPTMGAVEAEAAPATNASTYYYDMVNSNVQWAYNYLKAFYDGNPARAERYVKEFSSSEVWTGVFIDWFRDFLAADEALKADHPEYEWTGRVSGGFVDGDKFCLEITTFDFPTADMQRRIDARINQIVAAVGTGDRYTKLRKLTDLLISTSFYDPYLDPINSSGNYSMETIGHHYNTSPYGLLLEGVAICDGFSQAFKLLCNELNIPCIIMGNAAHAWNQVQMEDGKWYLVDLTNACTLGWDGVMSQTLESYFQNTFLNNDDIFGMYGNPYMISIDEIHYVEEFPALASGRYTYTGSTTNFSYTVPASTYTPSNGKFYYKVNQGGKTCTITSYEGKESGDLTIPGTLDGYTVTAIGDYAFYYRSGFTGKLTIPDSVEYIGRGAFAGCYGLTSVKWSSKLYKIGRGAFAGCKGLTEITFPDLLDEVGAYAFYDCNNLKSITFGSHIQTIKYDESNWNLGAFEKIAANAVIKAPAGSAAQTYATRHGVSFQASGTMCSLQSATGKLAFNNDSHFDVCQHGGRFNYGAHTNELGAFGCGESCSVCKAEYCKDHGFIEHAFTLVDATPATCSLPEYTGNILCACNEIVRWGEYVGEPTGRHESASGQWYNSGDTHYQLCTCWQQINVAPHTGGTATATQQAFCSVCGESYGDLNPGYTGTTPTAPVITTRPTVPTTGKPSTPSTPTVPNTTAKPGQTTAPTVPNTTARPGQTTAPTVPNTTVPGQTTVSTVPGQTTAPAVPGQTAAPTVPGQTNAPTTNAGSDPTEGTTPQPGATTGTAATNGSAETPTDPGSPVVTILLIVLAVAAVGAGGFFGFRFLQAKKKKAE